MYIFVNQRLNNNKIEFSFNENYLIFMASKIRSKVIKMNFVSCVFILHAFTRPSIKYCFLKWEMTPNQSYD